MELTRRGILAGLGVAGGVGAVGFVGAATVTDDNFRDAADGTGTDAHDETDVDTQDDVGAAPVDPDSPFDARLVTAAAETDSGDGADDDTSGTQTAPVFLFDASDLDHVQTETHEDDEDTAGEHLVYVSVSGAGRESLRDRLAEAGVTDDPERFAVSMSLDGETVRRVDLDQPTVAALTDEAWGGVLELPFETAALATDVYESLAA
ncbi:MAG: hypothetical protein PPP55_05950 [Halorubrum sp.]